MFLILFLSTAKKKIVNYTGKKENLRCQ